MYADRVEAEATRSVKERLNGSTAVDSSRRRTVTGKRQRQDDKWEHDLFDEEPSNSKVGTRDLRLKLQKKKGLQQSGMGRRDLRDRLSGSTAKSQVERASEAPKPTRRNGATSVPAAKSSARPTQRRKTHKDAMESFLESLGLDKYLITFQAEEVDMGALKHMTDEDLKAMGIPMGPRKKIILALESKE